MAESAMSSLGSKQALLDCCKDEFKKTFIEEKEYDLCSEWP